MQMLHGQPAQRGRETKDNPVMVGKLLAMGESMELQGWACGVGRQACWRNGGMREPWVLVRCSFVVKLSSGAAGACGEAGDFSGLPVFQVRPKKCHHGQVQ